MCCCVLCHLLSAAAAANYEMKKTKRGSDPRLKAEFLKAKVIRIFYFDRIRSYEWRKKEKTLE
jgi:hypothetical protein